MGIGDGVGEAVGRVGLSIGLQEEVGRVAVREWPLSGSVAQHELHALVEEELGSGQLRQGSPQVAGK